MIKKLKLIFVLSLLLSAYTVYGQEWLVPDDAMSLENPVEYTLENVEAGKVLYLKNCKSCHGDPGKNNVLPLVPAPVDIASEKMHQNTEGAMFYKISEGRGIMLQFELTLTETEIWTLVSFIRNYKPGGEQLLIELPPVKAKLMASLKKNESLVEVTAEFAEPENDVPTIKDAGVILSLKRAFGNLEISQALTDENGRAEFELPPDLIRDEEGLLTLVVSMTDDFEAKELEIKSAVSGKPKEMPQILEEGVLYSTNDRMPIWLIISYFGAVGGVWLVIGYVVFQIVRVNRLKKD